MSKHLNQSLKQRSSVQAITLIEVLVVVALLFLIILAIFRVFSLDIGKSRDAQRKKDLHEIKRAFEDYYNDHSAYPPSGSLDNCNESSLSPYLKTIPCDPVTGKPYVYLPLDNGLGYRVLSRLSNLADPVIEELNCQNGCGVPIGHDAYDNREDYVYGISEGIPVSDGENNLTPGEPDIDAEYCASHTCFCCPQANQDCGLWFGEGECGTGPFDSASDCYSKSACHPI